MSQARLECLSLVWTQLRFFAPLQASTHSYVPPHDGLYSTISYDPCSYTQLKWVSFKSFCPSGAGERNAMQHCRLRRVPNPHSVEKTPAGNKNKKKLLTAFCDLLPSGMQWLMKSTILLSHLFVSTVCLAACTRISLSLTPRECVYPAHPVNSLSHMPSAPPSRSASVQTRRTYTVTIRDRKVEACTEFPNANPHLDSPTHRPTRHWDDQSGQTSTLQPVTPKDQNRLRVLRQDPSVASLLDLYDNKGRLDNDVFSNSPSAAEKEPIKDGRIPLKRGSSTLRQLLGNPESTDCTGSTEGDISWAETFLRYGHSLPPIWLSADCVLPTGRGG